MLLFRRALISTLLNWKDSPNRKPAIIRGARQVGKSSLVRALGEEFPNFVEINFELKPALKQVFEQDLDPKRIVRDLQLVLNTDIIPGSTLLFFDEIQECPNALRSLRYFYEQLLELHVIAAGSLLQFEMQAQGVPVGRIQFYQLFPLSFCEFLEALEERHLLELLNSCALNMPIASVVHEKLLSLMKLYLCLGGMPQVIKTYAEQKDLRSAHEVLGQIANNYRQDFHKYAKASRLQSVEDVFLAIPCMIGAKFKASTVRDDQRAEYFFDAMDLLSRAGVAHKVMHTSANGVPLGGEAKSRHFKPLSLDIGLTQHLLGLNLKDWASTSSIEFVNRGTVAEQFTGQELLAYQDPADIPQLYYWHREARSSNAEVDYVCSRQNQVIPLEVKSGRGGQSKSMLLFLAEKKAVPFGIRVSAANFGGGIINDRRIFSLPLYALWRWKELGK
jgi:uncharacterized protein